MRIFSTQGPGAAAREAKASLGDLPEWNLADLYSAMDAPELAADIERAGRRSMLANASAISRMADVPDASSSAPL